VYLVAPAGDLLPNQRAMCRYSLSAGAVGVVVVVAVDVPARPNSDEHVIETTNARTRQKKRLRRVVQTAVSLGIVLGIFAGILPRIADYSDVWTSIRSLTWFELVTLLVATAFASAATWPQIVASLPGLTLAQAAVSNQASTAIANTLPGGGMLAVGVNFALCRSWGFPDPAIALSTFITFVWNTFFKLILPVIALAILAIGGKGSGGLLVGSLVGLGVLLGAISLLALMHRKLAVAEAVGSVLGSVASFLRKLIRRPPVTDWAEAAVRFRKEAIHLIASRWIALTLWTVVGHLAVYLVLMLAVRDVGISAREITWAQILGVFAFARLLSALPVTPGGLGIVDLGYIGGLVLAGRQHVDVPVVVFQAQVAAAVLLFRTLTYGLQIPLGAVAFLIGQHRKGWRKASPSRVPGIPFHPTRGETP
jgi:putative heme transporter